MTREYREYAKSRIEYLLKICKLDERDKEALEAAIQALSQEPCEDTISRDAVMRLIENKPYDWSNLTERHNMLMEIRKLPSVTQKSGKWISVYQGDEIINYRCSECEFGNTFGKSTYRMNFCPNCGAKMESEVQTDAT